MGPTVLLVEKVGPASQARSALPRLLWALSALVDVVRSWNLTHGTAGVEPLQPRQVRSRCMIFR